MRVDAILGMDFINLFDELRIYPKEKKLSFLYHLHRSPLRDVT